MSGAMGGSKSEEFLAPIEVGEDSYVHCPNCGFAANVEAVITRVPAPLPTDGQPEAVVHDTPDAPTIATICPARTENDTPRRIRASPSSYANVTSRNSTSRWNG